MREYNHKYLVSTVKVQIAMAKNLCCICRRGILKGEKYILVWYVDQCVHPKGEYRRSYAGFHRKKKYCRECSSELLNLKSNNCLTVPSNFTNKIMEALKEMLHKNDRYSMLKETNFLNEYLKERDVYV
jgi:hypothetical protein